MSIEIIERVLTIITNLAVLVASTIAIYVYFFKSKNVISAINLLLNYSNQLALSDLKGKLERLNEFDANNDSDKDQVLNILHEIEGQISGSRKLKIAFGEFHTKLIKFTSLNKNITEPTKRSLVAELRQNLIDLDVNNYNGMIKEK